jgi:Protein of unknown function (DUF4058)
MPSPFPGMDPYLEDPEIFPDFHDRFITYVRENLQESLPVPYFAAIGRRLWIEVSRCSIDPNVEVRRAIRSSQACGPFDYHALVRGFDDVETNPKRQF